MALLEISFDEHTALLALMHIEPDIVAARPELQAVQARLRQLRFNDKLCAWCGTRFEAPNDRKTTCSDKCRQSLSRSKRSGLWGVGVPKPRLAVGDAVHLIGYEDESEPIGVITEHHGWIAEPIEVEDGVMPPSHYFTIVRPDGESSTFSESVLVRYVTAAV
jgi:hypothetical protein